MFAIPGATGKVGERTIRTLMAHGHPVRAIVRDASRAAAGCEIAVAQLDDQASLTVFNGAEAVQVSSRRCMTSHNAGRIDVEAGVGVIRPGHVGAPRRSC